MFAESGSLDKIDSRTLPVDALDERRRRAVKAYEAGGWMAVDLDRAGRPVGSGRTLSADQEREVQRLIRDRAADPLKRVDALWTRQPVTKRLGADADHVQSACGRARVACRSASG